MKKTMLCIACGLVVLCSFGQAKKTTTASKPAAKPAAAVNPLKTNIDSVSYSVGLLVAQNLKTQGLANVNIALFERALNDVQHGKTPLLSENAVRQCMTSFQQKMQSQREVTDRQQEAANRQQGAAFLAANGKRSGVTTLPDGVQYEVLKAGTDTAKPTINSTVKVHYHGTLINGTIFDSSVDRGEPVTFPLTNVIHGWQEILPLMTVGSKWKIYLPADQAYGSASQGSIGPGSTLVFEVELLGIEK